jgi:hypothetical protein
MVDVVADEDGLFRDATVTETAIEMVRCAPEYFDTFYPPTIENKSRIEAH